MTIPGSEARLLCRVNAVGTSGRSAHVFRAMEGKPWRLLRAQVSEIAQWKTDRIFTLMLDINDDLFTAERVQQRYLDLGFDVWPSRLQLLRPGSTPDQARLELACMHRCSWAFLPFMVGEGLSQHEGMNGLVHALSPLLPMAKREGDLVTRAWKKGIAWAGFVRKVPGIRSALRIMELENVQLLSLGLSRAERGFRFGRDSFQGAVHRVLDRRGKQHEMIARWLARLPL